MGKEVGGGGEGEGRGEERWLAGQYGTVRHGEWDPEKGGREAIKMKEP